MTRYDENPPVSVRVLVPVGVLPPGAEAVAGDPVQEELDAILSGAGRERVSRGRE